jgi:hypothetical protein
MEVMEDFGTYFTYGKAEVASYIFQRLTGPHTS